MRKMKTKIRQDMKKKLQSMDKPLYEQKSREILHQLIQSSIWHNTKAIGLTISIFPEVDTYSVIRQAWKEKKQVAVAKCIPESRQLRFHLIHDFHQLEKGFFGLIEPIPEKTIEITKEEMDLLIVPGVAFTKDGYRIGHGGGYYDRYLPSFEGMTISLAFQEQIVSEFPIEEHDCPVQKIFTEKSVIHCNVH